METLHKTHASFLTASVIVTIAVVFGFFTGALSGKAGASYCPLSGQSNRTVVYFGDLLISDQAPGADKQISLPAGTYNVTLSSYDDHDAWRASGRYYNQPNESFYVALKNSGDAVVARTNAISDIGEYENQKTEMVNSGLVIPAGVAKVAPYHANPDPSNSNSLYAVCAAFDLTGGITTTPPPPIITPPPVGGPPSVTTNSASNVGGRSATLNGYVDPHGVSGTNQWFEWGISQSLGSVTTAVPHSVIAENYSLTLQNLSPNTTYYYRIIAQNSGGTTRGSIVSFTTSLASQVPYVITNAPQSVSANLAVLNGYVDPRDSSDTARWFEWGTNNAALTTATTKLPQGNVSGTFSDTIAGLSSGTTYYYRAVAQNSAGIIYGGVQNFTTSGSGNQAPFVSTNGATGISSSSATLNCYVNPYSSSNTTRWFEWGSTQSFGNKTGVVNHGTVTANGNEIISGLSNNTTYYFRCAAQNQYGTSYGSALSFYTGTGGGAQPTVITNLATNIGQTSARLNGLGVNLSNTATDGWFEWGASQSLGNTSSRVSLGNIESKTFYYSLFGLEPNTTYYFRAVVENNNGKGYGDILNFRTNSAYVPPATPTETPKIRDASITKTLTNLSTGNGTDTSTSALRGHTVRFTIKAENTGDYTLANTSIKDRIPYYLEFANATEKLAYNDPQREVVWFIGDLPPRESRTVILDVIITDDAPMGTVITNIARIEADRLTKNSNETTITVSDVIGAAAVGFIAGSFFPTTFLGWLLLLTFILILVLVIRALIGRSKRKTV